MVRRMWFALLLMGAVPASAQVDARMFRQPAVSADKIAFDITFPSLGPDAVVFQKGGRIYLLNLPGEKVTEVPIRVVTDATTLRARTTKADKAINTASVSPTGRRVAFEARGDVVTLPAERGAAINLTRSSGVADRYPRWSPDGKTLAYWSDRGNQQADRLGAETPGTAGAREANAQPIVAARRAVARSRTAPPRRSRC